MMQRNLISLYVVLCVSGLGLATPPAPPTGKEWLLTFEDNFNGTSLDTSKWTIGFGWGRTANNSSSSIPFGTAIA